MKSPALFALHFTALLLLGSLQNAHNLLANAAEQAVTTPGVASAPTGSSKSPNTRGATLTTTTLPPPSLPKPNRSWLRTTTTPMTLISRARTITPTTTTTVRRPTTYEVAKRQKTTVVRNITPVTEPNEAEAFTSTRLARNINVTLRHNVRQSRSFQSIDALPVQTTHSNTRAVTNNTNNNNNNSSTIEANIKRNHRPTHRQLHASGIHEFGSTSTASSTVATKATTLSSHSTAKNATTVIPTHQHVRLLPTSQPSSSSSTSSSLSSSSKPESRAKLNTSQRHSSNQQQQQLQRHLIAENSEDSAKEAQTTKTPRMIHRLMAGHIQNSEGRLRYQISTITTNSTVTKSALTKTTTSQPKSSINFRRKVKLNDHQDDNQKSILKTKFDAVHESFNSAASNTRKDPKTWATTQAPDDDRDDDEALLDESDDFDNWDNGILRSSAGAGKENLPKSKKTKEETKKTLSDQVRDGKYGLIEKELFRREPKRPGVLSYLPNKEMPVDNDRNFGGLDQEDIWLAEDHLLVIKGGSLNEKEANEPWPAIDDYDAPGRQIKIPPNPKVPPPFPVQLDENGPLQFIGNNKFALVDTVANESLSVYTAGPEAGYAPPESDDEKNLLTRPGSPQSLAEEEPGNVYPPPIPSWLYHNQTFVNPFLKNSRPINLPGLGLFPFGYNDSRGNNSDTDYFDEDDPSLYYPPPYSFVYKSNYSSPVAPGPLVPGIVLPPPPNQFSRLQKPKNKFATSSTAAPPSRQRVISTTTTTTAPIVASKVTTSMAPSPTTSVPHRQTITRISEYTPKIITITSAPVQNTISTSRLKDSRRQPLLRPSQPDILDQLPVPVPVAIPVPILPPKHIVSVRPSHLLFAPDAPKSTTETFSKSHPIYYEYYDPTAANARDGIVATTPRLPNTLPKKLFKSSKSPLRPNGLINQPNYLQPLPPQYPYGPENIQIYITPKPDTRPYNLQFSSSQQQQQEQQQQQRQQALLKEGVLANFEREVNAIRQRVRFYQNQQLRDNDIPRTPKTKPLRDEFLYDAEDPASAPALPESPSFQPPSEYDEEPFKPMVTYSPEAGDNKYFRAVTAQGAHGPSAVVTNQKQTQRTRYTGPTRISQQFGHGRQKTQRSGTRKYSEQLPKANYPRQQEQQQQQQYHSGHRHLQDGRQISPWLPLDEQAELNGFRQTELVQQHQTNFDHFGHSENNEDTFNNRNRNIHGYYYASPPLSPPMRQNNRFYDEPFQNADRKIVNAYRLPIPPPPPRQQQRVPPVWSLENDTYVNFAPNHPPINPDAEIINPFQTFPINRYENQNQQPLAPPPPPRQTLPLSHQSHYYGLPERFPLGPNNHPHHLHQQHQQQPPQRPISLDRDILVNYRQPLPLINPDSEYIPSGPQVVHPQADSIRFHSNVYPVPVSSAAGSGQPAVETLNPYYLSQKYRHNSDNRHRSNHHTNNNNNNNNDNNDNPH